MPSLSSSIDGALVLCGDFDATLHHNLIGKTARIVNQIARMMMREARLSEQNQYLRFLTLTSPTKEQSIASISDPNSICTVELLSDDVNDSRTDVPIIDRLDLNKREERGEYCCARFGSPTKIRFTWNPSENNDTIYVGYEVLPSDSTQLTSIPNMPESFHDVLQYRSAAIVRETILEKANTPVFLDTMKSAEDQWLRWCKRDGEQRPTQRPAHGSLDTGDMVGDWF